MGVAEIIGIITGIVATIPVLIMLYKLVVVRMINTFKRISGALDTIEKISAEFQLNGGASLRDAVNRIEMGLLLEQHVRRATSMILDVGILETDSGGQCTFVNRKFLEISGLSLSESLGFGWTNAVHPGERDAVQNDWIEAIEQKRIFNREVHIRNTNPFSIQPEMTTKCMIHAVPMVNHSEDVLMGYIAIITPRE